ncbi:SDR family NAD(P)-dependent oxidoreductase [Flavobacteriaceae bacterium M23B6Z8]
MSNYKSLYEDYPIGVFSSEFTGNELFLADHIIQGQMILPGMAYLELSRAAVANSIKIKEDQMIVLSDSVFVQAILVTNKRSIEVKVYPGATNEFGVEVSSDQGVHFQTKALIKNKEQVRKEEGFTTHLDIENLKEMCHIPGPTKSEFYENMRKREVILGPSHQGIETIHINKTDALVSLSLPGSSKRGMVMDPGMLDSVIQSGIALAENPEADVVPFAVKNTFVFDALTDKMYAHAIKAEEGMDYIMADEDGEIKVIIKGFMAREIEINSQEDRLVYYTPEWKEESDNEDQPEARKITKIKAKNSYEELVKEIFSEAKRLIDQKVEDHLIVVTIPDNQPAWKGIHALLKTVSIEYPKISYTLKVGADVVHSVYSELDLADTDAFEWSDNTSVLITGGLGGVGKLICLDIANKTKGCKLILVGRSELTSERKKFISELQSKGSKVVYEICDVSKQSAINNLIQKYPNIRGVIHCSGTNKDNLITKKTNAEVDTVLAPKVAGLNYLDEATANLKLDYFIVFSSIAGALGNAGQTDYAAANAYMDSYITTRSEQVKRGERFGKSVSVNWPLWESDGMQLDEETKKNLQKVLKIKPLPAEFGLKALKTIMSGEQSQVVVLYGNKKNIKGLFSQPKPKKKVVKKAEENPETDNFSKEILKLVKDEVADHLKRQANQLDEVEDWAEFGFDSILLSSFVNKFNSKFNLNMMPTVMFEATNIEQFTQYLITNFSSHFSSRLSPNGSIAKEETKKDASNEALVEEQEEDGITAFARSFKKRYTKKNTYRDRDLAIIGMSCKIPGARNPDEFWDMLNEERDMISEIPKDRWDWRDFPGISKWGAFVEDIADFDSLFFGISPAEATYMSPEQRLMLQYIWECMEDAGYSAEELKGTDTGLFMGCGPSSYVDIISKMPVEAYSATGMVPSVGPNRVSFYMDWRGPSNPIDTACSSSLVALHRAMEAINLGHCDQAFIGGVNALLSPSVYISFAKSGMLCEDGRCKTFSDKANGYVRGEGIGVMMVKPLKDAIRDGNQIHAVVKGTAENHGGHANSLTAPNPKSQAAVIKRAVKDAGIDFSRVSYVECHGTGTPLGDPIEVEGLKMVAAELSSDENHICKLGSIKSNIGHLEYGAGIVGLIKVVLQMKHKKIAKSLHCDTLNRYIQLDGTPFEVAKEASNWETRSGEPRVAGVSSFGFGGVNAHIILEEYVASEKIAVDEEPVLNDKMLLVISAKNKENLAKYVAEYRKFIDTLDQDKKTLERIAYTLQFGRSEMEERVAFVADSFEEWSSQIDAFLTENGIVQHEKIFIGSVRRKSSNKKKSLDQNGEESIEQLVKENKYEKLAKLWVEGSRIDWELLYESN